MSSIRVPEGYVNCLCIHLIVHLLTQWVFIEHILCDRLHITQEHMVLLASYVSSYMKKQIVQDFLQISLLVRYIRLTLCSPLILFLITQRCGLK